MCILKSKDKFYGVLILIGGINCLLYILSLLILPNQGWANIYLTPNSDPSLNLGFLVRRDDIRLLI